MPKIIWKVGGQEKQRRKKRSGECPENGNKAQSDRKELQERLEAVLMKKSSVKLLQKRCVYMCIEREYRKIGLAA